MGSRYTIHITKRPALIINLQLSLVIGSDQDDADDADDADDDDDDDVNIANLSGADMRRVLKYNLPYKITSIGGLYLHLLTKWKGKEDMCL